MRVLGTRWLDGYIDYWRDPEWDYRIEVAAWQLLEPVPNQYVVPERSLSLVWAYFRRVGARQVFRKIRSRLAERQRNIKYTAIGIGQVLEPPSDVAPGVEDWVLFLAYNHPQCCDRVCIDKRFVVAFSKADLPICRDAVLFHKGGPVIQPPPALRDYFGWSRDSGNSVDSNAVRKALRELSEAVGLTLLAPENHATVLETKREAVTERTASTASGRSKSRVEAVLFGMGNYAKTQILPNLDGLIQVVCIHETDPVQIGRVTDGRPIFDSSPWPRDYETYVAWFIAGYHHTHAPLAIHALRTGAYAVIEKPLATTWEQLGVLREQLCTLPESRLFSCFHRRYSVFNTWMAEDLGSKFRGSANYHCIVYEIPLPSLHWYQWPNSCSRLTSNGCHWVDHFMFLNNFAEPRMWQAFRSTNGDFFASVELTNGALFTMTLTDSGSGRLGVRDHVEVRSGDVTIKMTDGTFYEAETTRRIIRKAKTNPALAYASMYRSISEAIVHGKPGDDPKTLRSTELVLRLEASLGVPPVVATALARNGSGDL